MDCTERAAPSLPAGRQGRRSAAELAVAGLVAAIVLAASPRYSYPVRNLTAELSCLALALPLGYWAVSVHVRRRQPRWLRTGQRLYLLAFVLRVLALQVVVGTSVWLDPNQQGHLGDDGHIHSFLIRTIMGQLGREDPSWRSDALVYGYGGGVLSAVVGQRGTGGGGGGDTGLSAWLWLLGVLSRLTGFSTEAVLLPLIGVACFFLVQCWVFLHTASSSPTASAVAAWMLVAPDQIVLACGLHKDFATAIGLIYLCEFGSPSTVPRPAPRLLPALLTLGWVSFFRPEIVPMYVVLYVALWLHRSWAGRTRSLVTWGTLAAMVVATYLKRNRMTAELGWRGRYEVALLANLWAAPILKLSTNAFYENPNLIGMCDLPTALLWPGVMGLLAVGVVSTGRFKLACGNGPVLVVLCWLAAIASSGWGLTHRFRLPVDPLIIAYSLEALAFARSQPPRTRGRLAALAALVAVALLLIQLAPLALRLGR